MSWRKLCGADDVAPGTMREFDAGGVPVVLVRGDQGFLAIPPTCPHMDNALVDGFFDGGILTCNKHLWQWSIPEGEPMGPAECPLLKYPAEARGAEIWVDVERELTYDHEE